MLDWGRNYTLGKFKGDLIAGMTIASLCIPQDIGYAKLAGLLPQYGLCKCTYTHTRVSIPPCCDENFAPVATTDDKKLYMCRQ
jgi:hypothetical protein